MKRIQNLVALLAVSALMSSCTEQNDPFESEIKSKIVGKWKTETTEGNATLTNDKTVNTYHADGTVEITVLKGSMWYCSTNGTYSVNGRTFTTVSDKTSSSSTVVSINEDKIELSDYTSDTPSGRYSYNNITGVRVTKDFSSNIIGLWEGVELTGPETFGAADHRWEYKTDGTYVYYTKDDETGEWIPDQQNEGNTYYVDGDFFSSRWLLNGAQYKEWWDIEECNDTRMLWSALRKGDDGRTFSTTLEMKRVRLPVKAY